MQSIPTVQCVIRELVLSIILCDNSFGKGLMETSGKPKQSFGVVEFSFISWADTGL